MNVKNLKDLFQKKEQPSKLLQAPRQPSHVDKSLKVAPNKQFSKIYQPYQKTPQKKIEVQVKPITKINKNNDFLAQLNKKLNNGPSIRPSYIAPQTHNPPKMVQKAVFHEKSQYIHSIQQPKQSQFSNELKNRMKSYREDVVTNQPIQCQLLKVDPKPIIQPPQQTNVQPIYREKPISFLNDLQKNPNANPNINKLSKTPEKIAPKIEQQVMPGLKFNHTEQEIVPEQQQKLTFSRIGRSAQRKEPELQMNFNDIIGASQSNQLIKSSLKRRFGRQQFRQTAQYQAQLAIFLKQLEKNQFQSRIYAQSQIQIANDGTSSKGSVRFQEVSRHEFKDNTFYSTLNYQQKLTRIGFVINSVFKTSNREVVCGNNKLNNQVVDHLLKKTTKQNNQAAAQKLMPSNNAQAVQLKQTKPVQINIAVNRLSSRKSIFNNNVQTQIPEKAVEQPKIGQKLVGYIQQMATQQANLKPAKKQIKRHFQNFDDA